MKQRSFLIMLAVLVAAGLVLTAAHVAYAADAYARASIIQFVAEEVW